VSTRPGAPTGVLRIGNCSGFYGDRLGAMREMLEGGALDVLTGDYLAELTMLILGRDRMQDATAGYAKTYVRQLEDCLALALERGVRLVANAGGLNPAGLAERIRDIAAEQGLACSVAHVEGDDLVARADELGLGHPLTANAYLGAWGIAEALRAGADVVVTGRVTDASLVVGPAIAHFGWERDAHDALAGATVAGHVLECGTQATGGNVPGCIAMDLQRPGFPLAELAADGSSVITKHPGSGGAVTVDTVTAQLVYEIGGPAYAGPDVVTLLDTVRLRADGPDRVRIEGVRGTPPPPQAKVCLNSVGGFRNSVELLLTGLDVEAKTALVQRQLAPALEGVDSEWVVGSVGTDDPATQAAATTRLTCHVRSTDPDAVGRRFSSAAVEIALASFPGFTMTAPPGAAAPFGVYTPAYVDQAAVPHRVVLQDGRSVDVPPPAVTATGEPHAQPMSTGEPDAQPVSTGEPHAHAEGGRTRRAPLGRVAHARSGDKGGDANVGVWIPADHPQRAAAYAWLAAELTAARVRELLPEAAGLEVEVHHLPRLRAVNVVLRGLLGQGVAASTRLDPQAKALGEWLRARHVDIPELLLEGRP
jgi:hypothetical protein